MMANGGGEARREREGGREGGREREREGCLGGPAALTFLKCWEWYYCQGWRGGEMAHVGVRALRTESEYIVLAKQCEKERLA